MSAPVLAFTNQRKPAQVDKPERLSPLMKKIARLEQVHPRGAHVIEKLVDDLLKRARTARFTPGRCLYEAI
jgi:hypothetical protein